MKNTRILAVMLFLGVLLLSGCDQFFGEPVSVAIKIDDKIYEVAASGTPDYYVGGLEVKFLVDGGNENIGYEIDYGDGESEQSGSIPETGRHTFVHIYKSQGAFTVIVTSGTQRTQVQVTVLNNEPILYTDYIHTARFERGQLMKFAFVYRIKGCDNGTPQAYSGIYDPDMEIGDSVQFKMTITGPDRNGDMGEYTQFDYNGNVLNGDWLSPETLVYIEVGTTTADTIIPPPFGEATIEQTEPKGCVPDYPDEGNDLPITGTVYITCEYKDSMMLVPLVTNWAENYWGLGCQ